MQRCHDSNPPYAEAYEANAGQASEWFFEGDVALLSERSLPDFASESTLHTPHAANRDGSIETFPSRLNEPVSDAGQQVARYLRILGRVASRNMTLDEAHRSPPGGPEYDARVLLVAAYEVLSEREAAAGRKRFAKREFNRLAVGIMSNGPFNDWTLYFQAQLAAAREFWATLGLGRWTDSRAILMALEALHEQSAPAPTVHDLAASPFYRTLKAVPHINLTRADRRSALRQQYDDASDAGPNSQVLPLSPRSALPSILSLIPEASDVEVPWSQIPVSFHALGACTQSRPDEASIAEGPRPAEGSQRAAAVPMAGSEDAPRRIARLLRILAAVASRNVWPDEIDQPTAGGPEYDARVLLVAGYNVLSTGVIAFGEKRMSKTRFSELVGGLGVGLFNRWTHQFKGRLSAATECWARLGFSELCDARATIDHVTALEQAATWQPTRQDLKASPFYRKLTLIKLSGVGAVQLREAKRQRMTRAADDSTSRVVPQPLASSGVGVPQTSEGPSSRSIADFSASDYAVSDVSSATRRGIPASQPLDTTSLRRGANGSVTVPAVDPDAIVWEYEGVRLVAGRNADREMVLAIVHQTLASARQAPGGEPR